jgi:small subunit ribosomal protein S17
MATAKTEKPKAAKVPKAAKTAKPAAVAKAEPTEPRGSRKLREGIVVSNKMAKTVVVNIERRVQHPLYGKIVQRSTKFKAHDEIGCDIGDRVEIMETRPMSREKRWRVTQILEKVK